MKFCKDCKWMKPRGWWIFKSYEFAKCMKAEMGHDPVTGKPLGFYHCSTERKDFHPVQSCGPGAKNFEPRNEAERGRGVKDSDKVFYMISVLFVLAVAWVGYNHHPVIGFALVIEGLACSKRLFFSGKENGGGK